MMVSTIVQTMQQITAKMKIMVQIWKHAALLLVIYASQIKKSQKFYQSQNQKYHKYQMKLMIRLCVRMMISAYKLSGMMPNTIVKTTQQITAKMKTMVKTWKHAALFLATSASLQKKSHQPTQNHQLPTIPMT